MALTVEKICNDVSRNYKMELIAGKKGLDNIVSWTHIIEDIQVGDFLEGHELVFTTGIGNIKDTKDMLAFITHLIEKEVSALVINIGPYITHVSKEVIEFCDEKNFPLYTCPWEVKLVEVTRHFCEKIINSETNEKTLISDVKDYIFYPSEREKLQYVLERRGLSRNINYCVITLGFDRGNSKVTENDKVRLEFYVRKEIERQSSGKYVLFWYERNLSLIIAGMTDEQIKQFVSAMELHSIETFRILMGISPNSDKLNKLDVNFERSRNTYNMCLKQQKTVLNYDDLGIYKILFSVNDKSVLRDFNTNIIGSLIEYDKNNETDYYDFLKIYIENDGSIQKTADALYVHRNTVNYKIGRIKKIINMDITNLDTLLLIKICIEIENI